MPAVFLRPASRLASIDESRQKEISLFQSCVWLTLLAELSARRKFVVSAALLRDAVLANLIEQCFVANL